MKWRYYQTGSYTEKKKSHWLKQWPIRKGSGDKKGELSLVEDLIWTLSKRLTGQPIESSRGLGNLQRVNEFFLFAEKRILLFLFAEKRIPLFLFAEKRILLFLFAEKWILLFLFAEKRILLCKQKKFVYSLKIS